MKIDASTLSEDEVYLLLSGKELTPEQKKQLQDAYNQSHPPSDE